MKIRIMVLLGAVGAFTSGCMTHTPRVLPADHGLTAESALATIRPLVGSQKSSTGSTPKTTADYFQYWDWDSSRVVSSHGNMTTYAVPLKTVQYREITNVTVETFIWISPGSPFLVSSVILSLADGHSRKLGVQNELRDACMMLPPFWFFSPKWSVHKANKVADSFLLLRELQLTDTNRAHKIGDRSAFEDALQKSMSTGGLSSDKITLTYPDGTKKTISKPEQ